MSNLSLLIYKLSTFIVLSFGIHNVMDFYFPKLGVDEINKETSKSKIEVVLIDPKENALESIEKKNIRPNLINELDNAQLALLPESSRKRKKAKLKHLIPSDLEKTKPIKKSIELALKFNQQTFDVHNIQKISEQLKFNSLPVSNDDLDQVVDDEKSGLDLLAIDLSNKGNRPKGEEVIDSNTFVQPAVIQSRPLLADNGNARNILNARTQSISSRVNDVISRAMSGIERSIKKKYPERDSRFKNRKSKIDRKIKNAEKRKNVLNQIVSVKALGVDLFKGINNPIENFKLIKTYDLENDLFSENGNVNLKINTGNSYNITNATIIADHHFQTSFDIQFEKQGIQQVVPMISFSSFDQLLKSKNVDIRGGHLLIDLHQLVLDVVLGVESNPVLKLYLDESFKEVENRDDARYVFFLGVDPGITLVQYFLDNNQTAIKFSFVDNNEIFFESNQFNNLKKKSLYIYKENVLSNQKSPLDIQGNNIKRLAHSDGPIKRGLNQYELPNRELPIGTREYLELEYLDDTVFLGLGNQARAYLPSEDYRNYVLGLFGLSSLSDRCLIQVNLSKKIDKIAVHSRGVDGGLYSQMTYLESTGKTSIHPSEMTTKAFVIGEDRGIFNFKINYIDGTEELLQTYCSQNTYLVEQL